MNSQGGSHIIWEVFAERAQKTFGRTAISTSGREISFEQLFDDAHQLAEALEGAGINPGDMVCHTMKSGIEFVVAYLALCRLSATVALVPEKYRTNEIAPILTHLGPKCFVTNASLFSTISNTLPVREVSEVSCGAGSELLRVIFPDTGRLSETDPRDRFDQPVALVKFTSGSTGSPKAVALSPRNVMAETRNIVETLALTEQDVILAALPLAHSYGFDLGVLAMLASGARLIIHENFIPRKVMRTLEQEGVTIFLGVPGMYKFLLETPPDHRPDFSRVRYLLSCTAPLNRRTLLDFHSVYGAPPCQHYGSSETGAAANHIVDEILRHPDAVGRAMKNVHLKVVDSDNRSMPSGSDGEVVITGDAVALGYLMGQPNGRDCLHDGSYWTGDRGCLDEDGFLSIQGRIDQIINVGGHKVSPHEVASALENHAAVREAAVVGIKDTAGDELVVAVVTLSKPVGEEALLEFCRGRLAAYKVPRRIIVRDELPKSATGKVTLLPGDISL